MNWEEYCNARRLVEKTTKVSEIIVGAVSIFSLYTTAIY
jgi:hypothetical protein